MNGRQKVYDSCFVSEVPYRQRFRYDIGEDYGFSYLGKFGFAGRREYTADDYMQFCNTHSDHITMKDEYREPFFEGLREAVLHHGNKMVFDDSYILHLYRKA